MNGAAVIALVALVFGSGIGLAAIGFFVRMGREMQKLDDRAERLEDLEKKADALDDALEDVRDLKRRTTQIEDTREIDTERLAQLEKLDAGTRLRRVERAFSQSFPRVRLHSQPETVSDDDEEDNDTREKKEK